MQKRKPLKYVPEQKMQSFSAKAAAEEKRERSYHASEEKKINQRNEKSVKAEKLKLSKSFGRNVHPINVVM